MTTRVVLRRQRVHSDSPEHFKIQHQISQGNPSAPGTFFEALAANKSVKKLGDILRDEVGLNRLQHIKTCSPPALEQPETRKASNSLEKW